ncbi:PTS glucose transporter subunit IIA [Bifidobacterium sp. MA2]|uniref:PTS glucose transporter subunit IIA n=1 Tax=Bifidobacterium santillanense TaxID=2809028 RepID=A0ABS5UND3_9BIFI|nr:beta-glucoside-specific PTS transporter subunit IIABC [Bifidobacterium santillanense]MBT1172428.1 PTS glucose transporter subunit IIA [Bifidobacterium santillanense]
MSGKDYSALAHDIVDKVGGPDNVVSLYHCVTRLRFRLRDGSKARRDELKHTRGVLSLVEGNGQFQVVIGSEVENVYDAVQAEYRFPSPTEDGDGAVDRAGADGGEERKPNIVIRLFNTLSTIFNPVIPALAGAGMLKAVLVILTTYDLMSADGSTYKILAAAGNSVFYFLPLFLAVGSARTFKCNPFISLAIVGALMEPNFTGLMKNTGDVVDFLGIPTVLMGYSGTVIPAILSIWIYSHLERLLRRFVPKSLEIFLSSMIALFVMVPLSAIVIGPLGVYLGNGMGEIVNFLSAKSGLLTGALIGGGWTFLVMVGIHWGIVPIMVNNLATRGYDVIRPMIAAATFASAGAALGAFFRLKDKEEKSLALSALFPALLGGITEPIVYGISVKYKRPLIAQVIGGAIAGGFMGAFQTKAIVYVFPALTTLPAFFGDTFAVYCIGIAMSFVITAVLTYMLGLGTQDADAGIGDAAASATPAVPVAQPETVIEASGVDLAPCVAGRVVPLDSVADPVFAGKAMGDGVAIEPTEGQLLAPADGEVKVVFPTGHAIGMVCGGVEILMHIGIDTVNMQGEGFTPLVKPGDHVTVGQPLVDFDLGLIRDRGYATTTMMVVTNAAESGPVRTVIDASGTADADTEISATATTNVKEA